MKCPVALRLSFYICMQNENLRSLAPKRLLHNKAQPMATPSVVAF